MLVLTRKEDQSIMIGNSIELQILKINKTSVEIGIKAPKSQAIYRKEVFLEIKTKTEEANRSSSQADLSTLAGLLKDRKTPKK